MDKVQLPHVDLMVCTACQLKCVGCTNFMGAIPQEIWSVDQVLTDARAAAKVMHAECVCILGGEPTSHPKLLQIMRAVKELGLGDRVQILTNGMRLHKMTGEWWRELDWLKISVYPGKTPQTNIDLAKTWQKSLGFQLDFYEIAGDPFRAVLTDRARSPEDAQRTYQGCWYRTFTRKIEQGYFYRCCTSPQIAQTVLGRPRGTDGIALEGLTPDALSEFLDRPTYMESCTRCYGNLGPRLHQWSEVRGDRDAWMRASTVPLGG